MPLTLNLEMTPVRGPGQTAPSPAMLGRVPENLHVNLFLSKTISRLASRLARLLLAAKRSHSSAHFAV
jgi:hypothetical protein